MQLGGDPRDFRRSSPGPTHSRGDPPPIASKRVSLRALRVLRGYPYSAAPVTRPDVTGPRSPARHAGSPLPMTKLPDVLRAPASSHKDPTGAGGQLETVIVIREQRFDIGSPSRYDSPVGGGRPNAAAK